MILTSATSVHPPLRVRTPEPSRTEPSFLERPVPARRSEPIGAAKAAVAFEAVVLRTFVEAMLPKDGFGEGTAGHMWRGQMADALADTLARSGGVGIAKTLNGNVT